MSVLQTFFDLKKLNKATKLAGMNNPDEVAKELHKTLNEALIAYSTGSETVQRNAQDELKNIRSALIAQQINAGRKQQNIIAAFSHSIDQFDNTLQRSSRNAKDNNSIVSNIANNFPSIDTITTAIITANPILGYGIRTIQNMARSRKEAIELAKKAEEDQQRALQEEQQRLNDILNATEESNEDTSNDNDELVKLNLEQIDRLINIEKTSLQLLSVWDESNDTLTRLQEINDEQLERQRILQDQEEALQEEQRREEKPVVEPVFDNVTANIPTQPSLFGKIMKAGSGAILSGLTGAVLTVNEFVSGFMDAASIIDSDEIGIQEKVIAGMSHATSGLLSLVDSVAEFFGVDLFSQSQKELASIIGNFVNDTVNDIKAFVIDIPNKVTELYDVIKEVINETIGFLKESASNIIDSIVDPVTNTVDTIQKKASEFLEDADNLFSSAVQFTKDTTSDLINNTFNSDTVSNNVQDVERSMLLSTNNTNESNNSSVFNSNQINNVDAKTTNIHGKSSRNQDTDIRRFINSNVMFGF